MKLNSIGSVLLAAVVSLSTGCSGHTQPTFAHHRLTADDTVEVRLRAEVSHWMGTPHRMGSTTEDAIDCSAFVMTVYANVFRVQLPRTTHELVRIGTEIPADALRSGDLVFFRPEGNKRHVGIYLGTGDFAHASTRQGVTVSRLDAEYWRKRYWTSRRVPTRVASRGTD